ncbi:MAG: DUF6209 family protein [Myxococcota bacterium]
MTEISRPPPRPAAPQTQTARAREKPRAEGARKGQGAKPADTASNRPNLAADSFDRAISGTTTVPTRLAVTAHASVRFGAEGGPVVDGELRQGGRLTVEYHPQRAPLRAAEGGLPVWGVTGHVRFLPQGEETRRPALEFETMRGRPTNQVRPAPFSVDIPLRATGVELWFINWTRATRSQEHHDDNHGERFRLAVKPAEKTAGP